MEHLLAEPAIVPDIFVSGLAEAEELGSGNFRFTLYAKQKSLSDYAGGIEYIVVARIVMDTPAILEAIQTTMKALGRKCCGSTMLRDAH
jgi:hypothetical protein